MLTISGQPTGRFCDGVTRRDFHKIGGLAMGGLSLPQILRAEAQSGVRKSPKSVIMIYLAGAPPHQDLFDLKMDAPLEIRGPYKPIPTKVPGIQISEHMPHCARIMDKLVPIRSMVGSLSGDHDSHICYTGRSARGVPMPPGGWPSIGSVMTKLCEASGREVPPFVGLAPNAGHPPYGSPGHPGFLGPACAAFRPNGQGVGDLTLNGITSDRLADRQTLLASFDKFRRDADHSGLMDALDVFDTQAFNVLTSSKLLDALDVSKESVKVRERYGKGDPKNYGDGAPRNNEHFLVARRLVEAGARCVTMNFGRWDFHAKNHSELLTHLPLFDQGYSALIEDLHRLGLDKDVPWSRGVNLVARLRSTRTAVAIIGRASAAPSLREAASRPARSSAPPIASAANRPNARSTSAKSSPRSTTGSGSICKTSRSPISPVARSISSMASRR